VRAVTSEGTPNRPSSANTRTEATHEAAEATTARAERFFIQPSENPEPANPRLLDDTEPGVPLAPTTSTTGVVFDIRRCSIHDGPGIRTTVFLKGCPLRCSWCHNPEGLSAAPEVVWRAERCTRCGSCIAACPEDALHWADDAPAPVLDESRCSLCGACGDECYAEAREQMGQTMDAAAVLDTVERDRAFYEESGGGVTFSGGEPLAQPEFLGELLRGARARDIHTALDTSGYAPWDVMDGLRGDVDLFLYDLKAQRASSDVPQDPHGPQHRRCRWNWLSGY